MFDDDGNPIAITNGVSPVYPCDTCRGFGDAPKAVRKANFSPASSAPIGQHPCLQSKRPLRTTATHRQTERKVLRSLLVGWLLLV